MVLVVCVCVWGGGGQASAVEKRVRARVCSTVGAS